MLSLRECSVILNAEKGFYSEEEIKLIRDFLYKLGEIGYDAYTINKDQDKTSVKSTRPPPKKQHG